jgi:S-formylglutathione hydrolase FrmB
VFRQRLAGFDQEAAVPINSDSVQRFYLPYDLQQGFQTSMAIANLSATDAATISVTFRSAGGSVRTDTVGTIPAQGHWAFRLVDLFPYLSSDSGVAEFSTTSGQLSVLGLRFNPSSAFTSFPAFSPIP